MVQHRILQYILHGLFKDKVAEKILMTLLDNISQLFTDEVNLELCTQKSEHMKKAVADLEKLAPSLMVCVTGFNKIREDRKKCIMSYIEQKNDIKNCPLFHKRD